MAVQPQPSSPPPPRPQYRWPWAVLALLVLGIALAILWMSREIQRARRIGAANPPPGAQGVGNTKP